MLKIGYQVLFLPTDKWLPTKIYETQLALGYSNKAASCTHVATYIGKGQVSEAILPSSKESYLAKKYKGRDIVVVRPKFATRKELDLYMQKGRYHIALASNSKLNISYGFMSLLWWPLHFISTKNWLASVKNIPFFGNYCSLKEAKAISEELPDFWKPLNKPIENVLPADFFDPNLFEIIWEGAF